MSRPYQIPVYRAEREAGIADVVRANASLGYEVPLSPLPEDVGGTSVLREGLKQAFAARNQKAEAHDLYFMRDVMVTTGWNTNKDVFTPMEVWSARHTAEHKPFNFEHKPLDIIGHITESIAVDENMQDLNEDLAIEELPGKFHVVNGSVLYLGYELSNPERQRLMEQTVAEIERGEWFVSMECFFRGFDYGVIGPDGAHVVVPRTEASAWMTKHLAQYGGRGVYVDNQRGVEFALGRVFRNITFKGKGLVRRPANPESVILQAAAAFTPTTADSGYLTAGLPATSSETEESTQMPESNAADQALREQVASLQSELATLKSKDSEATVSKLTKDMVDREATIASLTAQVAAITESSKAIEKRASDAEVALASSQAEVVTLKAKNTKRDREAILVQKDAPSEVVASLVESFAALDDVAFAKTVEVIAPSWKRPEVPKAPQVDPVKAAITHATVTEEAALATANEDTQEQSRAALVSFLGQSLKAAREARPSVYAPITTE